MKAYLVTWISLLCLTSSGGKVWRELKNGVIIDSFTSDDKTEECYRNQTALNENSEIKCLDDEIMRDRIKEDNCTYNRTFLILWTSGEVHNCTVEKLEDYSVDKNKQLLSGTIRNNMDYVKFNVSTLQRTSMSNDGKALKLTFSCKMPTTKTYCLVFTQPELKVNVLTTTPPIVINESVRTTVVVSSTDIFHTDKDETNFTTSSTNQTTSPVDPAVTKQITFTVLVTTKSTSRSTSTENNTNVTAAIHTNDKKDYKPLPMSLETTTKERPSTEKHDKQNRIILYVSVSCAVLAIVCIGILISCCCRRKRNKKKHHQQEFLISMAPLEDPFGPTFPDTDLYAVPKKKKTKQQRCFQFVQRQKSTTISWSGYDEVGSLIEGTYEKQESRMNETEFEDSKLHMSNQNISETSADVIDDPYEMIGRKNSFNREPLKNKQNAPITVSTTSPNIKLVDSELRPSEIVDIEKKSVPASTFSLGGSIRIKQQRTSTRKSKGDKTEFSNNTHEDVTITPSVSVRSSPTGSCTSLDRKSKTLDPEPTATIDGYEDVLDVLNTSSSLVQKTESNNTTDDSPYEEMKNMIERDCKNNAPSPGGELKPKKNGYEQIWNGNNESKENETKDSELNSETQDQSKCSAEHKDNSSKLNYIDVDVVSRDNSKISVKNQTNYTNTILKD